MYSFLKSSFVNIPLLYVGYPGDWSGRESVEIDPGHADSQGIQGK